MENDTKRCPFCGEEIKSSAVKCRFCGEFFTKQEQDKVTINKKYIGTVLAVVVGFIFIFVLIGLIATELKQISYKKDTQNYQAQEEVQEEEAPSINTDDCVLILGNTCYMKPFRMGDSDYLSFIDCMKFKDDLGIEQCYYDYDRWAGVVSLCGGIQNVPTEEELSRLAEYLYDIKIDKCPDSSEVPYDEWNGCVRKFEQDYPRNEDAEFVKMMKEMIFPEPPVNRDSYMAQENMSFAIWSNRERNEYYSYERIFKRNGTLTSDFERNSRSVWGMCVSHI